MKILDRYIIRQFLLNFLILFVVLVGLYVLLDLIINFDEFIQVGQHATGGVLHRMIYTARVMFDYYWPQSLLLYIYMAGLLPVAAAGFTLANLVRSRELVAMLASGMSMYRIATPILVMGFAANMLLVIDREVVVPELAFKISRPISMLKSNEKTTGPRIRFLPDGQGDLFTARRFDLRTHAMTDVTILRREKIGDRTWGRAYERISAAGAHWDPEHHGWKLTDATGVRRDIKPGQTHDVTEFAQQSFPVAFLPSDLDPISIMLRERNRFGQLLSLSQLSELIDRATQTRAVDLAELLRIRHSRFSLIVINMLILCIALPYFLQRAPRPLLLPSVQAAAVTLGAWAGGILMLQMAPSFLPPAAIAWLPVAMYLPWAWYRVEVIET